MAPIYKSAGPGASTEASGAAHNLDCPATVDAGDLLVAHLSYEGTTVAPTGPGGGWTLIDGPRFSATLRFWCYAKIADGSEDGATINFGSPANTNSRHGRIYSFSGTHQTIGSVFGAFTDAGAPTSSATVADASVTTTEADCLALNFVQVTEDIATFIDFAGESGGNWTEAVAQYSVSATTPDWTLQLQTAAMAAPGTIDGGTYGLGAADNWATVGTFLKPPAAAATPSLVWQSAQSSIYSR